MHKQLSPTKTRWDLDLKLIRWDGHGIDPGNWDDKLKIFPKTLVYSYKCLNNYKNNILDLDLIREKGVRKCKGSPVDRSSILPKGEKLKSKLSIFDILKLMYIKRIHGVNLD